MAPSPRLPVAPSPRPRIAVIGTGGSIAFEGRSRLDLAEYSEWGRILQIDELLALVPEVNEIARVEGHPFRTLRSTAVRPEDWLELNGLIHQLLSEPEPPAGIVITHGTNSIEETAYFLHLTVKSETPVVVVGAQRPPTGVSADAQLNLINAVRLAAAPEARGKGVLVMLNDEISSAREVTKSATYRLETFRTHDLGFLGYVDADGAVAFYRAPTRAHTLATEFDARGRSALPRVDVVYSYAGADGVMIDALVRHGVAGIVSAGQGAGMATPAEVESYRAARAAGILVVQASRVGSGRVVWRQKLREAGFVAGDNLNPQKARILAMLALTVSSDPVEVQRMFDRY
ncbi:MAG: asparaginase [Chloroflexi bacterium]|nr:asparaginase [Chloroflexota bacterium]